jgi:hypothetical protein
MPRRSYSCLRFSFPLPNSQTDATEGVELASGEVRHAIGALQLSEPTPPAEVDRQMILGDWDYPHRAGRTTVGAGECPT